jgi:NAD-dependent dihydropyrimidine dehydrogenase PreA subunit
MIQRLCEKLDCEHLGPCVEMCSFGVIMSGTNTTQLPKAKNKKFPRRCFVRGHKIKGVYPRYIKNDECVAILDGRIKVTPNPR